MRTLFIIFFICTPVIADECAVGIEVKPTAKGDLEISLENNSSEIIDFAYHDLPWVVSGQGGVGFKIYIDNKEIPVARGNGNNNQAFRLWPKSKVSGVVDATNIKTYYRNIDRSRVKVEWFYSFSPEGKFSGCKIFAGDLPAL